MSMRILETRSEGSVKITVTQEWYVTHRHPKTHPHTKYCIPTCNNTKSALDTIILETRTEVKFRVTGKWYMTLCQHKMQPHTKFGIPTSKNIGNMHSRSRPQGWYTTLRNPKMHPHNEFGIRSSNNIRYMLRTQ